MHEYPVTQEIVRIAEESARKYNAVKITKITLVVGELAGFIGESISMYFEIIAKGTMAEGAALEIKPVKAQLKCDRCDRYFDRPRYSFTCPVCGENGRPTEIGKEFYVENIEIIT
ncbi:MAG: hydrogenase maturation nickel metallochaperone HypA [Heliobacteriaceae bacterium]|nr:hydrogenase maturation nickel metallochaperone HypA [Heliobacteriaceae bacterium]MDD4587037.1 hydrogenase maturation nickel metallochaperone HypA [Heliobacteriaceae bacterium]